MAFNANDPSGAGGLSADIATISSVGGHALSIMTGTYVRDTSQVFEHFSLDEEAVTEQARMALEDVPVQIFKVGFVGNPENIAAVAEISSDYPDIPVVAYMPNLSWWNDDAIENYMDAFEELLLPQTSVLVGNHSTLARWLLPNWSQQRAPSARDIAAAAAEKGAPYTLVTGMALPNQHVDNVLASPETILAHVPFELFDAVFTGAGDTLSAALAALLATGMDLTEASTEALSYLDRCLHDGFRPGMGHVIPDRFFWAEPDEDAEATEEAEASGVDPLAGFVLPPHDIQH
jgi:hydroxymethylpyrimidine/phosphomethylpyrimidine kinase